MSMIQLECFETLNLGFCRGWVKWIMGTYYNKRAWTKTAVLASGLLACLHPPAAHTHQPSTLAPVLFNFWSWWAPATQGDCEPLSHCKLSIQDSNFDELKQIMINFLPKKTGECVHALFIHDFIMPRDSVKANAGLAPNCVQRNFLQWQKHSTAVLSNMVATSNMAAGHHRCGWCLKK